MSRGKATTKPRGAAWYPSMYVHSDTEARDSRHDKCGKPVREQVLSSQPPVTTDESAYCSASAHAVVCYCPDCEVRVEPVVTIYEEVKS